MFAPFRADPWGGRGGESAPNWGERPPLAFMPVQARLARAFRCNAYAGPVALPSN